MTLQKKQPQLQAEDLVFELLAELGQLYLELGKYDNAIAKLKLLVELDESDASASLNLSRAYLLKKQFDSEALSAFERALKLNPDDAELAATTTRLYLEKKRDDDAALAVYAKTLRKEDDKNVEKLAREILNVLSQRKTHARAHDFINRFRENESRFRLLVALYVKKVWEERQFDEADKLLKSLLNEEANAVWKHLYLTNLWKIAIVAPDNLQLSATDLDWFKELVGERQIFDSLADVYHFLAVNRLFQRFPVKADASHQPAIEEYELFISGDTFSNIWDLGLNKREISGVNLGLDDKILLEKMRPLMDTPAENKENPQSEVVRQSNCLFVLRTDQGSMPGLRKTIKTIFEGSPAAEKPFIQAFEARDGFIVFGGNIEKLTGVAKKLVKKQEQVNETNGNHPSPLEIVINSIALAPQDRYAKYLFDDLEVALSLFARDETFLLADRINNHETAKTSQIFVTESVQHLLAENKKDASALPAKFELRHPASAEAVPIFKLNVHDALDKIENGALKSVGKFQVNQELHQNQIFSSFKAVDSMLERLVVLKVLKPGFEIDDDPELTKKTFLEQARRLGQLTHPNIALIYDIGEDHQLQFFAREYVDAGNLSVPKESGQKIDWKKSLKLGLSLADILAAVHKKAVIHGRLKPANIFV
ncbi:MAG: protein kinase, partial [Calditrichaeota bacterium]|nr:protein kinase [Calditrichota bacterium]